MDRFATSSGRSSIAGEVGLSTEVSLPGSLFQVDGVTNDSKLNVFVSKSKITFVSVLNTIPTPALKAVSEWPAQTFLPVRVPLEATEENEREDEVKMKMMMTSPR